MERKEQAILELRETYKESLFGCDVALRLGDGRAAREFAYRADYAYKALQQAVEEK